MNCRNDSLMPSSALVVWLQRILRERINSTLTLTFNTETCNWKVLWEGSEASITLPYNPNLYELGDASTLPNCWCDLTAEGFMTIGSLLPAPGLEQPPQHLLILFEGGVHLDFDIPGLAYWMLARCEEIKPTEEKLDDCGRFAASSSHAFRHGYLDRPIVDEWLGILRQVIGRIWPKLPLVQCRFQVMVSHDVDAPSAYGFSSKLNMLRGMTSRFLKHRDLAGALMAPRIRLASRHHLHPADPYNTFEWLMDQSEAAGIRSAFYFMCGRTDPRLDAQYEPDHPAIRQLMRRIHQRGHEIGLHPSYNTCCHPERIAREGNRLKRICDEEGIEQDIWGGRMHYLRWQWPTTAYGWEQAGFHYDSSLSYADRPGFRCGTCHQYQMFDPVTQRQLRLIQRPLIVMECSVANQRYLGLGYSEEARKVILRLKQNCQRVDGVFSILWHNSTLDTTDSRKLYLEGVGTDEPYSAGE